MNKNLSPQNTQPDWMIVFVTHDIPEAYVISGRLDHEGIPCFVHTQPGASAMGITIGSMGEVKVLVKPEHYDRALDILYSDELDELPDQTDDYNYEWDDDE